MYYINVFFIYSILGFLFENVVKIFTGTKGTSGIFYGPFTPVYGIGTIIIIVVSNYIFRSLNAHILIQTFVIFITIMFLLSLIELIGGILIEKIFKITFWNYSHFKYSIGKYIALEMAFVWGFMSIILIYLIKPIIDKLIYIIPNNLTIIFIFLFIIDIVATLILKTKIKNYLFLTK